MSIQIPVACGILRQICGFRGYPKADGETRFVEVLAEVSLSVEHAMEIVKTFDSEFPTLREIRDTALNLRARFETQINQHAEWEKQYGKPEPFPILAEGHQEPEIFVLWRETLAFLRTTRFDGKGDIQQVPIGRCWQIAKHLGYKMNRYQQDEIDHYEAAIPKSRESLPVKRPAITQADVDAVKRERDVKALAGNDDLGRWE